MQAKVYVNWEIPVDDLLAANEGDLERSVCRDLGGAILSQVKTLMDTSVRDLPDTREIEENPVTRPLECGCRWG